MKRFWTDLVAAVEHAGKRLRGPRRERRARLDVESLEERLALSASPLGVHGPVLPNQPVHGYKWRKRWPRPVWPYGQQGVSPAVVGQGQTSLHPMAVDLVFGGTDGFTGLTTAGHI